MNHNTICAYCKKGFHAYESKKKRNKSGNHFCSMDCSTGHRRKILFDRLKVEKGIDDFKEWLERKYHDEKLNVRDMAEVIYGKRTHSPNILVWMEHFGIDTRSRSEAVTLQWEDNTERRKEQAEHTRVNLAVGTPGRSRLIEVMQTDEYRKKTSEVKIGVLNPMWNEKLTADDRRDRNECPLNARWVRAIKRRDDETCQCCGIESVTMVAHHLNGFHWDIENRHNVENGVTLCVACHNGFHKKYGRKNNTKEQYEEYSLHTKSIETKQLALL